MWCVLLEGDFAEEGGLVEAGLGGVDGAPRDEVGHGEVVATLVGMQWSEEIEAFATWSVKYDLWCKMRFFRDMLHSDIEGERTALQRGPVGLLSMLSKEFTREDVKALRIAQGMKPDPNALLRKWIERGVISKSDTGGVYVKCSVTA